MFEALFVAVKEVTVEAIFDDFRNFHKIGHYLHGDNLIGLVWRLQEHSI